MDIIRQVQDHVGGAASLLPTVQAALAMAQYYRGPAADAEAAEGAMQTARAAMTKIDEHLSALRALCQSKEQR